MTNIRHTQTESNGIKTISSPWSETFDNFVRSIHNCAIVVSPFITADPLKKIASLLYAGNRPEINLLTNLDVDSLLHGTVDGKAIAEFCREIPTTTVRHLPGLHAKVYVADEQLAIVTSGNLTSGSLYENYEYGIQINDSMIVQRIARDMRDYGGLGAVVSLEEMDHIADVAAILREKHSKRLGSARTKLKQEFENQLESVQYSLMQLRAKQGESTHAIFARTILYLLEKKPLATREMHPLIQNIHPDLCNDHKDRIINGVHFGKEWKHRVRSAQSDLKRKGLIDLVSGQWKLV